ncbi:hypothetical protein R1flu_006412 [Riccia fluitans]|uniref:Cytochrome P450 n=1 Tax=Riccia fluitans TaxID=41844 RepID=A0ABD1YW47_9MARC
MVVVQTEESPHKHSIRVRSAPRKFIRNRAGEHLGIIVLGPPNETWRRCRRLVNMELMNPKRLQQSESRRTTELLMMVKQILKISGTGNTVNLSSRSRRTSRPRVTLESLTIGIRRV